MADSGPGPSDEPTSADLTKERDMNETSQLDELPAEPTEPTEPAAAMPPGRLPNGPATLQGPADHGSGSTARQRGPSVPTIVWGVLVGLVAAAVVVGQVSSVDLDLDVSVPIALLVAGLALVVWGVAGLGRSRRA